MKFREIISVKGMVNLKSAKAEIFFAELRELSDKLMTQENQDVYYFLEVINN